MAVELRERRADSRVILRSNVFQVDESETGEDERGRHAIAGPPEWIAERLSEYLEAGCDGFVLNLDYESQDLKESVQRFAEQVVPLPL